MELCLLARQAGWRTLLLDRRPLPPACRLADEFLRVDVAEASGPDGMASALVRALEGVELVFPALENDPALLAIERACARMGVPLAFDPAAYAVSSSKLRSREYFERCGTPIPRPAHPDGPARYPLIAKPSAGSGSRGVRLLHDEAELLACLPQGLRTPGWIVEAYCPGRQFSLEICGTPGSYRTSQLTELLLDDVFDCRGVLAPASDDGLAAGVAAGLRRLAEGLALHGSMDVEVVAGPDGWRVLEIDARFPSQTPLAVWLSTGRNLAEELAACFLPLRPAAGRAVPRPACYLHVACRGGRLCFPGEHSLTRVGPLRLADGVPGTEGMLLGGDPHSGNWAGVLLLAADSEAELRERREGRWTASRPRTDRPPPGRNVPEERRGMPDFGGTSCRSSPGKRRAAGSWTEGEA